MKTALLIAALLAGCDTWAAHPITVSAVVAAPVIAGGALLIDDGHPIAGGVALGATLGVAAVAFVLGVIIDNYNDEHRGARAPKACAP